MHGYFVLIYNEFLYRSYGVLIVYFSSDLSRVDFRIFMSCDGCWAEVIIENDYLSSQNRTTKFKKSPFVRNYLIEAINFQNNTKALTMIWL